MTKPDTEKLILKELQTMNRQLLSIVNILQGLQSQAKNIEKEEDKPNTRLLGSVKGL